MVEILSGFKDWQIESLTDHSLFWIRFEFHLFTNLASTHTRTKRNISNVALTGFRSIELSEKYVTGANYFLGPLEWPALHQVSLTRKRECVCMFEKEREN